MREQLFRKFMPDLHLSPLVVGFDLLAGRHNYS